MTDDNGEPLEGLLADALAAPPRQPSSDAIAAIRRAAEAAAPAVAPTTGLSRDELALRRAGSQRRVVVGTAAAAAVVAAFLAGGQLNPRTETRVAQAPAPEGTVEFRTTLAASSGGSSAAVVGRKAGIGRIVDFRSDTLPILPKGELYEVWFVGPGDEPGRRNRISAGTFHPDEQGRSRVTFAAAVDPAKYPVLSVTAEPGDGDPSPSGPDILRSTAPA